jgi:hypothetical protein
VSVLHALNPNAKKERDQLKLRWGSETNCTGKPRVCFAPWVVIESALAVARKRTCAVKSDEGASDMSKFI